MEAIEYLEQIGIIESKIKMKQEQLAELNSRLYVQGVQYDKEPYKGSSKGLEPLIIRRIELIEEIETEMIKLQEKKNEIINMIGTLKSQAEIDVLFYRFVKGMTWEQVAEKVGYYERHCRRIFQKAIIDLSERIN